VLLFIFLTAVQVFCSTKSNTYRLRDGFFSTCWWLILLLATSASACAGEATNSMQTRLQQRVQARPFDPNAWRLLGRHQLQQGQPAIAAKSLRQALELDPEHVAAHFDLANCLLQTGDDEQAEAHLLTVLRLAPDCQYAADAESILLQRAAEQDAVQPVGYEITRFDGSLEAERLAPDLTEAADPKPWHFRLEIGGLFNSNPALAPISRNLVPAAPETFQLVATPDLELRLFESDALAIGSMVRGSFTQNEGNARSLNLQSYQPGLFLEKVFVRSDSVLVSRTEYTFSHDEFDGDTLGNRHSLFASLASVSQAGSLTFGYLSTDYTNFSGDGINPEITSQDGWTYTAGISHRFALDRRWLKSVLIGADAKYADLTGADFRFAGTSLFFDVEIPLTETILLKPEGGWGYRDYFDFTGSPSRNEHIWRGGVRLEKRINEHLSLASVFSYERFSSKNAAFAADRYTTGVLAVLEY
jgi:tetratricopeptide (TPR) repeat protein